MGRMEELGVHPNSGQGASAASFVHSVIVERAVRRRISLLGPRHRHPRHLRPDGPEPRRPDELPPGEEGDAHSSWLAQGGRLLIETHETFAPDPTGFPFVYDISNPANPVRLERVHLPGQRLRLRPRPEGPGQPRLLLLVLQRRRHGRPLQPGEPAAPGADDPAAGRVQPRLPVLHRPVHVDLGVFPYRDYILASDEANGLWGSRSATDSLAGGSGHPGPPARLRAVAVEIFYCPV